MKYLILIMLLVLVACGTTISTKRYDNRDEIKCDYTFHKYRDSVWYYKDCYRIVSVAVRK